MFVPNPSPVMPGPPPGVGVDPFADAVLLRRDMIGRGVTDRMLAQQLRRGELERVRHGAYSPGRVWRGLDPCDRHAVEARAVLLQARTGVVLSHVSALVELGAPEWGLDLGTVHVTRLDQRAGRAEAGVRQHRSRLEDVDLHAVRGVRLTSPTRTAIDATTVLGQEAALCHLNHLLHQGLTTLEMLDQRYEAMSHDPGTLGTGLLLGLASPLVESVGESRTFHVMWRFSVPPPVLQHEVRDGRGSLLARLDFAWPELGCWLEFDGLQKYRRPYRPGDDASDVVIREKQREDLIRRITGWRCLRITWRDLSDPAGLARTILAFLARR